MRKESWKVEENNDLPKVSSGRMFFSQFASSEQSYAAALRQDTQQQQPQAPQTYRKKLEAPHAAASATTGNSENMSLSTGSQFV
jgi:hypothetical protein